MRCNMWKEIQHQGCCPKSGQTASLGELPSAQAGNQTGELDSFDSPPADSCQQTTGSSERTQKFIGSSRIPGIPGMLLQPVNYLLALIYVYRLIISPYLPPCCRFTPSCSTYALEALKRHGLWKGFWLTCWRLLRCQPFCKGGYDPVPPLTNKQISRKQSSEI